MPSSLESPSTLKVIEPLIEYATHLEPLFPNLEWNLKRAGYTIDTSQYLAATLYFGLMALVTSSMIFILPVALIKGIQSATPYVLLAIGFTAITVVYLLYLPNMKISSRRAMIDRDLEYMLKDMQIQLSSRVPLFNTFVNVVKGGYGECSIICEHIIQEVQQGKSMDTVLDNVGMWSPSEYFRRMMWQIVNALKSGGSVSEALEAIAKEIRMEKENKIKTYARELNLYGLVYLMTAIILPSMGVTLLVILSSFLGGSFINMRLFIAILVALAGFQMIFIQFVKNKRPMI